MKYLKSYNESIIDYHVVESIKDYLKPKSEENIKKEIKDLDPGEKLEKACEYGIDWLVKELVEVDKIDHVFLDFAARIACKYGHTEIVKYLLTFEEVNPFANYITNPYTFESFLSVFNTAINKKYIDIIQICLDDERTDKFYKKEQLKELFKNMGIDNFPKLKN